MGPDLAQGREPSLWGREAGPTASEGGGRGEAGCRGEGSGKTVPDS